MNHWFLCARDVMWFFIAYLPLFLSSYFGWEVGKDKAENDFSGGMMFFAFFLQTVGISLLYGGVIR